ncbi:MAG: diguanylate cyclase [Solirubrobacteraceae bacterium]
MYRNERISSGRPSLLAAARRVPLWAGLAISTAVYLNWMIVRWGPTGSREVIGDLFQTVFNFAVVVLCWRASCRCENATPLRSAWKLITVGAAMACAANIAQLYYEGLAGGLPAVSLADVFALCMYAPIVAALIRFPVARGSGLHRLQLALDAAVLALGGFVVMWYVELGPAVTRPSRQSLLQGVVSVLYTLGDLTVLAVAAGVLIRGTTSASTRALRLFASACVVFVGAHVAYGYVTIQLHMTHSGGDWLDPIWWAGLVLWALAAGAQRQPEPGDLDRLRDSRRLRRHLSWGPHLAVGFSLGLLVYCERGDRFFPAFSVVLVTVVLIVLVTIRQLVAQREMLAVQSELKAAHDELATLATTDALTGLPNHRALVSAIDHELERAHRTGHNFAIAFLDVDHFKALNDTLGHRAGDNALRELGQVLRATLRSVDVVGRWGGEEFIALLPEIDPDQALTAAERLRATVAQHRFSAAGEAHLTCSIGVASRPQDGIDRDSLLTAADQAMYVGKQLGRNQAIAASNHVAAALVADKVSSTREEQSLVGAVEALAAVVNARDSYTGEHSEHVSRLAKRVALGLGCDANAIHTIGLAARLHDIGKVAVSDAILNKAGRLTDEEWRVIRLHPQIGADIAGCIPRLQPISALIRSHHERYDGTGYPDRLASDAIPLGARIICAVDAYSAMVTDRPYAAPRTCQQAIDELRRLAGVQFDPRVVQALVIVLDANDPPARPDPPNTTATGRQPPSTRKLTPAHGSSR